MTKQCREPLHQDSTGVGEVYAVLLQSTATLHSLPHTRWQDMDELVPNIAGHASRSAPVCQCFHWHATLSLACTAVAAAYDSPVIGPVPDSRQPLQHGNHVCPRVH